MAKSIVSPKHESASKDKKDTGPSDAVSKDEKHSFVSETAIHNDSNGDGPSD